MLCFPARLFIYVLWSPSGKGLTSWLSFVMSNFESVELPIGILDQVWGLIVSSSDLCPLYYFKMLAKPLELNRWKDDHSTILFFFLTKSLYLKL